MADTLDILGPNPSVLRTPTLWLINQALLLLNKDGERAELAYSHVIKLLKGCVDAPQSIQGFLQSSPVEDAGLRWGALYIAGELGDLSTAGQLYREAVEPLPDPCAEKEGCEGPRDVELLIRTMAVESLQQVAGRHPEATELIVKLVAARPAQPVLIEAVKAARALKLTDRIRKDLRKKDRWMLDIKVVSAEAVMAEPERGNDADAGGTAPGRRAVLSSPNAVCCSPKPED